MAAGMEAPALLDGIQKVRELAEIQEREAGTGDPYMVGLFNGLELALATIENRVPQFVCSSRRKEPPHA